MSLVRKGRVDPIELLREFIIQKKVIKQKKDKTGQLKLQFDNIDFKSSMETAWKSTKSNRYYNLGALWWFLEYKQKKLDNKEYMREALEMKIDFVGMVDQPEIEDYFTGKIDYTECINAEKKSQLFKKQNNDDQKDLQEPLLSKKQKTDFEEKGPLSQQEFHVRVIEEIVRFEKPITTKNRQFRCPDRSFESILETSKKVLYGQQVGQTDERVEDNSINFNVPIIEIYTNKGSLLQEILLSNSKPIVIVPQLFELGNICLKNAKKFLEEGEYIDPVNIKFTNESRSIDVSHHLVALKKQPNNNKFRDIVFEIRDTPNAFDQKTWKRVVGIFVRGSSYELKGFPNIQDIVGFFKRYRGYHMKYEDDKPKDQIKLWNVKNLDLHRLKRHYDQSVRNMFWEDLDQFILRPPYQDKKI